MEWNVLFFVNSILLGGGLAMDAFSVSLANGLQENHMKKGRMCGIAGVYAFFQCIMPLIGWICVHTIAQAFSSFETFIPWIALILLLYVGGKMLIESIQEMRNNNTSEEKEADKPSEQNTKRIGFTTLLIQGIATSIDALSVGFTIAEYNAFMALICSLIIAVVTFIICYTGLAIGKKYGTKLANKAGLLGGSILIFIGLEIFIKGVFF